MDRLLDSPKTRSHVAITTVKTVSGAAFNSWNENELETN